jgi:hypothetical protein
MLARAFKSLVKDDTKSNSNDGHEPSKMPVDYNRRAITRYETFVPIGLEFLKRLYACQEGMMVFIGFDIEWDALIEEEKNNPQPTTLQLATSDGKLRDVVHLIHMYSQITEDKLK